MCRIHPSVHSLNTDILRFAQAGHREEQQGGWRKPEASRPACSSGVTWAHCVRVCLSCPTLVTPMDRSPPGSWDHGIFQARILEWAAISYSRGSSQPRDRTHVSCLSCTGWWILYHCTAWEASVGSLPLFFGSCFLNHKAVRQVSIILTSRTVLRCKRAQVYSG